MNRMHMSLIALVLTACFSTNSATQKHADFHHCDPGAVEAAEVDVSGKKMIQTNGCGHQELFFCVGAKCRSPRLLTVRLFSAKHKCQEAQVQTTSEGETWTANGCGKTARYHCVEVPQEVAQCQPID